MNNSEFIIRKNINEVTDENTKKDIEESEK